MTREPPTALPDQRPTGGLAAALAGVERLLADGGTAVIETSGSTGAAKRALLPASALRASAEATLSRLGGPGQWLLALPVEHVAGYQVLVRSVLAGTVPVGLRGSFTAETFAAASRALTGARRYAALVPTQLRRVLGDDKATAALGTYDAILVGGAALDPALGDAAAAAGAPIVTTYGMTETCGGCVYDGVPLAGVLVDAPADGPIRLGGPVVFAGYEGRPDLTAAALQTHGDVRWHVTRDHGHVDADGRLVVLGRLDDMIITGGYNVAPTVVEHALVRAGGVAAAVVVGLPDPEWGQRLVAVVVDAAVRPPAVADVRAALRGVVPAYALPRAVIAVPELPMLASGKPDRTAVRRIAEAYGRAECGEAGA